MIIYKKDYISIAYYEAEKLLEITWLAYAPSGAYREAMLHYLHALQHYDIKRWLIDYRLSRVVRPSDQEWTRNEWLPRFIEQSQQLEKLARVKSTDISARISSENMLRHIDRSQLPYKFMEFEYYGEARSWLLA
ncbi:hypothetical protein [Pontibacter ramchanderi]|uniref:SpoIIAA-like protein n=1 Tax=Pontibacter ramchanderi TaxID=1179743 RepID=A0A2N3V0E1_9BACT|nr:hypothetical protein [Pontibacter ramchanderi]PKV75089.1 hypothetical protein BD749_0026 [Pontibacter ramchanderi]